MPLPTYGGDPLPLPVVGLGAGSGVGHSQGGKVGQGSPEGVSPEGVVTQVVGGGVGFRQ